MKKAILLIVLLAVLLFSLSSCFITEDSQDQGTGTASADDPSNSKLGNYDVIIESCRLSIDYEGKPIIIVKYKFTNNNDDPACFSWTIEDTAFQDGVGLNKCYFVDDSANYSSDNQTKEIKKGASLYVEVAYELNDTATDVEVEVSELISFNDKKISKIFTMDKSENQNGADSSSENDVVDADNTESQSIETSSPDDSPVSNLGKYNVIIESCRLASDYEGKPIIIVKYKFTNNNDDPACFSWTIEDAAFQDGVGLNKCYFVDDSANYSSDNQTKEIKKGASLYVEVAYELNDTTTDVEIEVSELFSFKGDMVTKTFSIE